MNTIQEKLRKQADTLQKSIDAKRNPGAMEQRPTRKRMNQIESSLAEAERLEWQQRVLRALADAHEDCSIPDLLKGITTRTQVELLQLSRFNKPYMHRHYLADLVTAGAKDPSYQQARHEVNSYILSIPEGDNGKYISDDELPAIELLVKADPPSAKWIKEAYSGYKSLRSAGIFNEGLFHEAKQLIEELIDNGHVVDLTQLKIKKMERDLLLQGKSISGFFPTPLTLVDRMLEEAGIQPGDKILEPSAGKGNIADKVRSIHPNNPIDVVEISYTLRELLELKGYNLIGRDFLEVQGSYDKIIMNPPFENLQDVDHVLHAYDLLNPGGTIVAIMSASPFFRSDKKATNFREWLSDVGGYSEELPDKMFDKAEVPTGVKTYMVVINKPEKTNIAA